SSVPIRWVRCDSTKVLTLARAAIFPTNLEAHMSLGGLPLGARLLLRSHLLPAAAFDHSLHPILERSSFGDEQIGDCRKFSDGIAGAGIPRKHNHPVRRVKAIGIGLVLAGSLAFMEIKMAVFDGCHFDVRVLVNYPSANIMTGEHLS